MKNNKWIFCVFGLIFIVILFGVIINKHVKPKATEYIDSKELVDLEEVVDSANNQIDTIYIQLKSLDQHYEQKVSEIITNHPDSNFVFFIEYIGANKERLDSVYSIR